MTVPEHPNVERLRSIFAAFASSDLDVIRSAITEDFVWHVSGPSRWTGDYRGFDGFLGYLIELGAETGGTMRIDPYDLFANEARGVALVTVYRERGDRALTNRAVAVYEFENGLISEGWFLDENPAEIEDFYRA